MAVLQYAHKLTSSYNSNGPYARWVKYRKEGTEEWEDCRNSSEL